MISNMYEIIQERDKLEVENKELKHENEALHLQSDTYFEQWQQHKVERDKLVDDLAVLKANISRLERENEKQLDLLQDFSKFINYKLEVSPASDTYKHYRSKLDQLGVK